MVKISRPGAGESRSTPSRSDGKASPVSSDRGCGIMTMTTPIHTRDQARASARQVRKHLAQSGQAISHQAALERVAHAEGYASWNVMSARLSNQPEVPLAVGDRVAGAYLSQEFAGTVVALRDVGAGAAFEVEVEFDEAVDVVTFPSFSNYRRRVRATISPGGVSPARTGDGLPHLTVARLDR